MIGTIVGPRYRLENDPMCGETTGGREDCFWDCEIINSRVYGPIISNPECLLDCFEEVSSLSISIISLSPMSIVLSPES